MQLKCTLYGKTFQFRSVKEVLGKANGPKSGDQLAGVAAETPQERMAAKLVLSELSVRDLREHPAADYESDAVTRIIQDDLDEEAYRRYQGMTIGELREWILVASREQLREASRGLTSEVIAGVAKLMGNLDLMYVAKKIPVSAHCNTTIGGSGVFASRLQPNHPTDDPKGVTASLLEGLSYACGDAVLGLNPAIDTVESTTAILQLLSEVREKFHIPTQTCVLSHISTQMKAIRAGAPADLCFQSIAGSQKALESFGTSVEMLEEAGRMMQELSTAQGPNYLYFETGQGSELSSSGHWGTDQQTMESRCYGLARHFNPFLVNTVVGFIGPEYLYDGRQVTRAALEDVFCGKMHGLPMGCDCCYTNHTMADQNDMDNLIVLMAAAGCCYVMGLPQGDDVMLMYQSTGFHDIAAARELMGLHPIREFEQWAEKRGILRGGRLTDRAGDPTLFR
jgi:ethanolamine ammonia-lyase large subunit